MRTGSISSLFLLSGLYGFACNAPPSPVEPRAAEHQHSERHEAHEHSERHETHEHTAAPTAAAKVAGLTRIDTGSVCMLSNRYLGDRPQVPVAVEGKTYYGCCANCAARLAERPDAREARDPITGHTVDKGSAILARDAQNRVLYFESEASLARMQRAQ
jgi:YHS domain-containing protein